MMFHAAGKHDALKFQQGAQFVFGVCHFVCANYANSFRLLFVLCFPRSASEIDPAKQMFLRGNAGCVGEILGAFLLKHVALKFRQLT